MRRWLPLVLAALVAAGAALALNLALLEGAGSSDPVGKLSPRASIPAESPTTTSPPATTATTPTGTTTTTGDDGADDSGGGRGRQHRRGAGEDD